MSMDQFSDIARRMRVSSDTILEKTGLKTWLGNNFLFIKEDSQIPQIIPLTGSKPVEIYGASVEPSEFPELELKTIWTDKMIYRENRDAVNLFICDILSGNTTAQIRIMLNDNEYLTKNAELDIYGCAAVMLRDLPAGNYRVEFVNISEDSPSCTFSVVEYKLAPLTAALLNKHLVDKDLNVTIMLESFSNPVNGKVRLDLMEDGERIDSRNVEAIDGMVKSRFSLTGDGPYTINIQFKNGISTSCGQQCQRTFRHNFFRGGCVNIGFPDSRSKIV